ncbi:unnamed protein product [Amoebophrya sp. A25]|nr:unnamed protein product [Amoebophrya sp. A25]|eukprot:GSA25T00008198001.1
MFRYSINPYDTLSRVSAYMLCVLPILSRNRYSGI